jgi:hypothetical protein
MEHPIYDGLNTTDARDWRDELWTYAHQPESAAALPPEEQRVLLEPGIERLLRHVERVEEEGQGGQAALGYQVLALMLLEAGCAMTTRVQQRLLEGIAVDTAGQGSPQSTNVTAATHHQVAGVLRDALLAHDLSGGTPSTLPPFKRPSGEPEHRPAPRDPQRSNQPRPPRPPHAPRPEAGQGGGGNSNQRQHGRPPKGPRPPAGAPGGQPKSGPPNQQGQKRGPGRRKPRPGPKGQGTPGEG